MKITPSVEIREVLFNHYHFGECALTKVVWMAYGTVLEFVFDYIYQDSEGFQIDSRGNPTTREPKIRPDLDQPLIKTLRFHSVQEFHVYNRLNDAQLDNPDQINWGFGEVSAVTLEDSSQFLANYRHQSSTFHHVAVTWEGDRRIDVVFAKLEVVQGAA
jgi:hypothetical protein